MDRISRRTFMAATAGTATLLGALPAHSAEVAVPPPPQVPLGKTGITLSRVGQGTGMSGGNRQSNHTRMGIEKFQALIKHGFDRGITFFDLADLYGTHIYYREAMQLIMKERGADAVDRQKLTLLTKIWWRYDTQNQATAEPWCKKACQTTLERFRHELMTDYIDIVLLHCLVTANWESELAPYLDALNDAKDKKQVRAVGVSCHELAALKAAAESPWVDVILARINPKGERMDAATDEVVPVLRRAKENGKAILGMKILGEGALADQRENCIKFAQQLGLIDAMTIGFEQPQQIDEVLQLVAKYPATQA